MLDARFGSLRPWEMERLTPYEERQLAAHYRAVAEQGS